MSKSWTIGTGAASADLGATTVTGSVRARSGGPWSTGAAAATPANSAKLNAIHDTRMAAPTQPMGTA